MNRLFSAMAALALTVGLAPTLAQAQDLSPTELQKRAIERRAVEAAIWGMPAVNADLMRQEMLTKTAGKIGQVIYLTHHRHLCDMAKAVVPGVQVHSISG